MDRPWMVSDIIRDVIGSIPPTELPYAKPSRILPFVEARMAEFSAEFKVTTSVQSMVSKLLLKAKRDFYAKDKKQVKIEEVKIEEVKGADCADLTRKELAMQLVEMCNGDFKEVRRHIEFVENIANRFLALPKDESKGEE